MAPIDADTIVLGGASAFMLVLCSWIAYRTVQCPAPKVKPLTFRFLRRPPVLPQT